MDGCMDGWMDGWMDGMGWNGMADKVFFRDGVTYLIFGSFFGGRGKSSSFIYYIYGICVGGGKSFCGWERGRERGLFF